MNVMKIAGKQTSSVGEITTNITTTSGMMLVDGTIVSSSSYVYSQKIPVNEGDIIVFNTNPSSSGTIAKLTAFNGDSAVSSDGIDSTQVLNYTVSQSINSIVLTFSSTLSSRSPFVKITRENATVKAIKVNEEGKVATLKEWESDLVTLANGVEVRDVNPVNFPETPTTGYDISGYAISSIRVISSLGVPVSLVLYDDISGGRYLCDTDGNDYKVTIPATTKTVAITADDLPMLNYVRRIRIRLAAETTPTEGTISVYLVLRR